MLRDPRLWQSLRSKQTIVKSVALTGAAAVLATLTLLIGGMVKQELSSSLPSADAQPATATSTAPSTSAGRTTQSARTYRSDGRGFLNSSARCSNSQVAVALGRTEQSLVVICKSNNAYQYRGVRQSDGATLTLPAQPTTMGGFVASNDGVTYAVSPGQLLVTSGETVVARESMIEYHQPQSFLQSTTPPQSNTPGSASGSYPAEAAPSATTSTPSSPAPEVPRVVG